MFGYACKLFRDDEKAASIDSGNHLIPWMGDPSLRIDRYDGRGALHNLEDHVAKPGNGHRVDPTEGLSDVEEELCEEERYRSLKHDDSEDVLKAEEDKKRQQIAGSFGQVGFSYDTPTNHEPTVAPGQEFGPANPPQPEEDLTPFTPIPAMNIPDNMLLPPTNKLYSVIAKTARFLANQGAQMEILLKAKQSNNPAFQFLNLDSPLNHFYKHLVKMIKTKQFIPQLATDKIEPQEARRYGALSLVPQYSNFSSSEVHIAPKIPTIKYKKDVDCSYSKLISLMKPSVPLAPPQAATPPPPPAPPIQYPPQVSTPPPPPQIGFHTLQQQQQQPSNDVPLPEEPKEKDPPIRIPPPDLQTIVDKMASYVSKNGRSFEEVVKSRGNPKFTFLNANDKHHQYYLHKLNVYTTGNYDPQLNSEPLTFKVKKSLVKEEPNLNSSNALPYEASDGSGDENEDKPITKEPTRGSQNSNSNSGFPVLKGFLPTASFHVKAEPELYTTPSNDESEKVKEEDRVRLENNKKVRDRLAAVTREKMIQVSREKALQLERKRKAAHFLAQLAEKRTMVSSVEPIEVEDEEDEEGEIKEIGREERVFGMTEDNGETISAVNIWPPPPPPQLVIPKLSTPQPPPSVRSSRDASPDQDSSDSDGRSRHSRSRSRKHKRHRSRSRSRDKRKRRKRSRSRSRSRHKKHRKHKKSSRRKKSSKSKRDHGSQSGSSEDVEPRRDEKVNEGGDSTKESAPTSPETSRSDHIDNGVKSQITEDLRAKVRAMLAKKESTIT